MEAYDALVEIGKQEINAQQIQSISKKYGVPSRSLRRWTKGTKPAGRKGEIRECKELYYVLGALLGDGCLYRYKITDNLCILVGSRQFAEKFAMKVNTCSDSHVKAYIDRSKNIWFVKVNNFELYKLFENCRNTPSVIRSKLEANPRSAIQFIEGFFDAEGCIKIVKEKQRKTAKTCLDMANTNKAFLEEVQFALQTAFGFKGRYSARRKPLEGRKLCYHLRIYKKKHVKIFLHNIPTTKMDGWKRKYVDKWLSVKNCHPLHPDNPLRLSSS